VCDLEFDEVAEERATPGGLRPDVLLLRQGSPVLGIEVLVTHAVDAAKAARTSHPWVELDALQVLAAPGAWRPGRMEHPWTGLCADCRWWDQLPLLDPSEPTDPGEIAAELAAAAFEARLLQWLRPRASRARPRIAWRCPWCRKANRRLLARERVLGAVRSTSLGPPILPEVIVQMAVGPPVSITFGFPQTRLRAGTILPLPHIPRPALRVTPDPRRPLRLDLNATNRPMAFICRHCGRDCLGVLPCPRE
jgi:hypothetical protein